MPDMIIGPPPETRWQRLQSRLKLHPGVQAAIVASVFSLLGLWLGSSLEAPRLRSKIEVLEGRVSDQQAVIQSRGSEIQRLETLLTPFRTIALERYTGSEGEALRKLADQITILQQADNEKSERIVSLEKELTSTKQLAEPCTLLHDSTKVVSTEKGLTATIRFKPTKNERLGLVVVVAELPTNSDAKILDLWATPKTTPFTSHAKQIAEDGKSARFQYSPLAMAYPSFDLKVTKETKARIQGNYGINAFEIDIKTNALNEAEQEH